MILANAMLYTKFLSTLSLRRATFFFIMVYPLVVYFYPRSPCGERPVTRVARTPTTVISIHALLAESDYLGAWKSCNVCHFYPRSPCGERQSPRCGWLEVIYHFYPRSPCGERPPRVIREPTAERFLSTLSLRRATVSYQHLSSDFWDFYPRSPCGERHTWARGSRVTYVISIHALLAESDMLNA